MFKVRTYAKEVHGICSSSINN